MTGSKQVSRSRRRFRSGLATAGIAAALLTAMPVASAAAASQDDSLTVMIQSAPYVGYVLCASPDDQSVHLQPIDTGNAYCQWLQIGSGAGAPFKLYNPAKNQVMAYTGGNRGAVVMEKAGTAPKSLGRNAELWTWGGWEDWGGAALQSFWDSGQNVDAKATNSDTPRTDPVHTRGWREGHQRELTWNTIATPS